MPREEEPQDRGEYLAPARKRHQENTDKQGLFKQFSDNPEFRQFIIEKMLELTYFILRDR